MTHLSIWQSVWMWRIRFANRILVLGAVRHGSTAVTAAMLELAGFHKSDDGIFTFRALHDLGIAVGGNHAAAFACSAHVGRLFDPHGFAFITHHGRACPRVSSG